MEEGLGSAMRGRANPVTQVAKPDLSEEKCCHWERGHWAVLQTGIDPVSGALYRDILTPCHAVGWIKHCKEYK